MNNAAMNVEMMNEDNREDVVVSEFREVKDWEMDAEAKIKLLERRLQVLSSRGKDNQGACRRIERDIRNLKKRRS